MSNTKSIKIKRSAPESGEPKAKRNHPTNGDTATLRALGIVLGDNTNKALDELDFLRNEVGRLRNVEARLKQNNPILFATPGSRWFLHLPIDKWTELVPLEIVKNTDKQLTFITHDMFRENDYFNPCTKIDEITFSLEKDLAFTMFATKMDEGEWDHFDLDNLKPKQSM